MKKIVTVLFAVLLLSVSVSAFLLLSGCSSKPGSTRQTFGKVHEIIEGIYHDQADIYMDPVEPTSSDNITIRIRVQRGNLTDAKIEFSTDVEKSATADHNWVTAQMYFEKTDESGYYDYWIGVIPKQGTAFRYHFVLTNKEETVYYNTSSDVSVNQPFLDSRADFFVIPDYSTPDWAKGTVWYSIMPDGFYNGDPTNDKLTGNSVIQNPWGNAHYGGNDYFGGDFAGISEKIEYLKWLGVDSVFMNPIWLTTHQAGYGSFDLTQIDSAFGNDEMLKQLISELHENNMQIMLDGVFQYMHSMGIVLNSGNIFPLPAQLSSRDPLYNLVMRDGNGNIVTSEWGQPYLDFSKKATREYVYSTENSVMQLYLREYGIDGWRMDVGDTLRGSDAQNWGNAEQILADMRGYVKDANSDALFLSEHGGLEYFTSGTLDSKWNYDFGWPVRDWAASKKNQTMIEQELYNAVIKLPRSAANASYNFLTTHDESRIALEAGDSYRTMAAQILTMTYVGSPCIFYGDEVGMLGLNNPGVSDKAPTSFSAMNWDQSTWDWEMLNLTRALTQLRKDYASVYKDGLYKTILIDLKQNLLGFGRWNSEAHTITVTNQNSTIVSGVTLDVKQLSLPDGTVLTDYLSGRTYQVKNGKAVVDVMPGGSVFVDGKGGNFTQKYEKIAIDNASATVSRYGAETFRVTAEGALSGTSDSLLLNAVPVFNNAGISAKVTQGTAVLMFRASQDKDAAFFAVTVNSDGELTVLVREKQGEEVKKLATASDALNKEIGINRGSDNRFTVYLGSTEIQANAFAELPYMAYAGFGALSGTAELSFAVQKAQSQLSTEFDNGFSSMFTPVDGASVADGKLNLSDTSVTTQAPYIDFTIRTKLDSEPAADGEYAFLTAVSDSGDFAVVLGRVMQDGTVYLMIGTIVNGSLTAYGKAENVSGSVYLQLQKSGVYYTGYYSDGNSGWTAIEQDALQMNLANINVGMTAKGTASFDMFAFGNSEEDGVSYGNHIYYGEVDYASSLTNTTIKYRVDGGTWAYCTGGIRQSDAAADAMFYIAESRFDAFKGEFTLGIDEMSESGRLGFSFGNAQEGAIDDDSFRFTYGTDGKFIFSKGTEEIAQGAIPNFDQQKGTRFVVDVSESGAVRIYCGIDPELIVFAQTDYEGGYFTVFGEKTAYTVTSYNFFFEGANWLIGLGEVLVTESSVVLNATSSTYSYASLLSDPVTDFILGANLQMTKTSSIAKSEFGVLIGTNAGKTPQDGGLYIGINDKKSVFIKEGETTLATEQLDEMNVESLYFMVVVQNGVIRVYIDNWAEDQTWSDEPVLEYTDGRARGGALNFYDVQSRVVLDNLRIYGLREGEDYTQSEAYQNRTIAEPPAPEPVVGTDFVQEDLTFTLEGRDEMARFNKYSGMVSSVEENGTYVMKIDGTGNWNAGAAIAAGKFENYELKFKMKTETGGWGSVILNKTSYNYNHETTGLMFYANTPSDGQNLTCYTGSGGEKTVLQGCNLTDGYLEVTIKAYGGILYIECGGQTGIYDIANEEKNNRKDALSGYISFNAGNCVAYFKDISVRILNEDGSYKNA